MLRSKQTSGNHCEQKIHCYFAEFEVICKAEPENLVVKKEPLAVKMEGSDENRLNQGLETVQPTASPDAKENAAPHRTPGAKLATKRNAENPDFTPPSTG